MHCQQNANNRQTGGFSDSIETGLAQLLDCTDCQEVKYDQQQGSDNRRCY